MADDVYKDAARKPPDPKTNKTTTDNNHKIYEAEQNKMETEEEKNQGNLVIRLSTTVYGTPNPNTNSNNNAANSDNPHSNSAVNKPQLTRNPQDSEHQPIQPELRSTDT
jgi:hypothetical protein